MSNSGSTEETLNLLSYNIRLFQNTDIFKDSQHHRSTKIPSVINDLKLGTDASGKIITGKDLDIISHYELWTDIANNSKFKDNLISHYKDNYKHTSQPDGNTPQNGDTIIFYHKNLNVVKEEIHLYKHKEGPSFFGSKGIVYIKFQKNKNSKIWFHLFATHTQDGHKRNDKSTKAKDDQMHEIDRFVEDMLKKHSEKQSKNAVILCGDFNTAKAPDTEEGRKNFPRDPTAWEIITKKWNTLPWGDLNDYKSSTHTQFATIRDEKTRKKIKKDKVNPNKTNIKEDIKEKEEEINEKKEDIKEKQEKLKSKDINKQQKKDYKEEIKEDKKDIKKDKKDIKEDKLVQPITEDGPDWYCIDHIFHYKDENYLKPNKCKQNIVLIQDKNGYKIPEVIGKELTKQPKYGKNIVINDLSDHNALFGTFSFKV